MKKSADAKTLAREAEFWSRIKKGQKNPAASCSK